MLHRTDKKYNIAPRLKFTFVFARLRENKTPVHVDVSKTFSHNGDANSHICVPLQMFKKTAEHHTCSAVKIMLVPAQTGNYP